MGDKKVPEFTGPTLLGVGNLRSYKDEIAEKLRDVVPIKHIENWFRERIAKVGPAARVLVLRAETSAGKSTVLPATLFREFAYNREGVVACFQPTTVTAIENVRQLCAQPSYKDMFKLGENIGWSTGASKLMPRARGSLLSATIGTLVMYLKIMSDHDFMDRFKFILIDEVHERSIETDTAIALLKNFLTRQSGNVNCPFVVLMSATFEPGIFLKYFIGDGDNGDLMDSNFIWVGGRSYPREEMWDWNAGRVINNVEQSAATLVEKIMLEGVDDDPTRADILIFMPGNKEAEKVLEWLAPLNQKAYERGADLFSPCLLNSAVVGQKGLDYDKIIIIPPSEHYIWVMRDGKRISVRGAKRRVIIGTAIAETGLTLDNLKYVIDSGLSRLVEFNPVYGIRGLITKPATKSRITQRIGRVGRKFAGVFYALYPKYIFDMLESQNLPQIITEDVSSMFLTIISEQIKYKSTVGESPEFKLQDIDLLEMPTRDSIGRVLTKLNLLGVIAPPMEKEFGKLELYGLTKIGTALQGFNMIPVEILRMIFAGYSWNCSILDLISIGAYVMLDSKLETKIGINWSEIYALALPDYKISESDLYRERLIIADQFIDGALLFNAAKVFLYNVRDSGSPLAEFKKWADKIGINYTALQDFITARDELVEEFIGNKFNIYHCKDMSYAADNLLDTVVRLKHCIYDGFRCNVAKLARDNTGAYYVYDVAISTLAMFSHTESSILARKKLGVYVREKPKYFIYSGLNLKYDQKSGIYKVVPKYISVMDGYINPDTDFY